MFCMEDLLSSSGSISSKFYYVHLNLSTHTYSKAFFAPFGQSIEILKYIFIMSSLMNSIQEIAKSPDP